MRNVTDPDEVLVSLVWLPPSPRNGPYRLELNYTALQFPPYPAVRSMRRSGTKTLDQNTSQFTIRGALPFAYYILSIRAINLELKLKGLAGYTVICSLAIGESVKKFNPLLRYN